MLSSIFFMDVLMQALDFEFRHIRMNSFHRFILALAGYIYWKYYYPYTSDGVKSGYLNFAVRKGQLFKTYEGKLIQEGIRSKTVGAIQSNEFEFSIKDKKIFDVLKVNSGKIFDLHYKEYKKAIPWRGFSSRNGRR